jgi:hypothetical protein
MEAIEIAENNPRLNTDSGWQLLPTIRKRVAREGRATKV